MLKDHSTAAFAYVGMTRGRQANTAHLVAADIAGAQEQWLTTFGRDRADLGPAAARQAAESETARYATPKPVPQQTDPPVPLLLLHDVRRAWDVEARCLDFLHAAEPRHDDLQAATRINLEHATRIAPLRAAEQAARVASEQAEAALRASTTRIDAETVSARCVGAPRSARQWPRSPAAWCSARLRLTSHGPFRFRASSSTSWLRWLSGRALRILSSPVRRVRCSGSAISVARCSSLPSKRRD